MIKQINTESILKWIGFAIIIALLLRAVGII
jgi:hypothetical protein